MIEVYYLDGGLKKGTLQDLPRLKNKPHWIDILHITREEAESLSKHYGLHPLTEEDLMSARVRIKIEEFKEYLLAVFYGIERRGKDVELIELDLVLSKNVVISNHPKPLTTIKALKKDTKRIERLLAEGVDFLFHWLIDAEQDSYFPVLEVLEDRIEKLEEDVIQSPKPAAMAKILEIKRELVKIRRFTFNQREKLGMLSKGDYPFLSKEVKPYLRDIYDHSVRVSDRVDAYRDSAANAFDVYMSAVSNNMNEVMKILSIIATIALPLTVISGVYGMNFQHMPGSMIHWGFWGVLGLMVLIIIGMLVYFRRRQWF